MKHLGEAAFGNCVNLTSVTIPKNVTEIKENTFFGCKNLTSIIVEDGNQVYDSRENCNAIIETATNTLIVRCQKTIIPNSVISIGNGVFSGCVDLISITIPEGVKSIGAYAFAGCSNLSSVIIPNSVTCIWGAAFKDCTSLTSVTIPDSVTNIPDSVFEGCMSLTSITIPDRVTRIGKSAFMSCTSLNSIIIPYSVAKIENSAFKGCTSLVSATFNSMNNANKTSSISSKNVEIKDSVHNKLRALLAKFFPFIEKNKESIDNIRKENPLSTENVNIEYCAFFGCTSLTSIIIPKNVTDIKTNVFKECTSLTSIIVEEGNTVYDSRGNSNAIIKTATNTLIVGCKNTVIPNSVTNIGNCAFSGCSGLISITIPDSVTNIGREAFSHCLGLISIIIPNSVTSINNYVFEGCVGLNTVAIPDSVTKIGDKAFSGCSDLMSITIPDSVTNIGNEAFSHCSNLTSITIPKSVKQIGLSNNSYDDELETILDMYHYVFPGDYAREIGEGVFGYCNNLKSIVVEAGNTVYDSRANCNAIIETATNTLIAGCQNTIIPNNVKNIEIAAFEGCSNLTSITIPDSVSSIGISAFRGCLGLTTITIPNGVNYIERDVFYDCSNLTSVIMPNSVTNIADNAFCNCSNLTSITIPQSVTGIDNIYALFGFYLEDSESIKDAFRGCEKLQFITVEAIYPPSINDNAFRGIKKTATIYVPLQSVEFYKNKMVWESMNIVGKLLDVKVNNLKYNIISGNVMWVTYEELSCNNYCKLMEVVIPESVTFEEKIYTVTNVGKNAFKNSLSLTSITISNSIVSIELSAFEGCINLCSIIIPNSVTRIGDRAFKGCASLTNISIPNNVTDIGDFAFEGCTSLISVAIPNTLSYIGKNVFQDCSTLASITIPYSVTNIENKAFYGCKNLAFITEEAIMPPKIDSDTFLDISSEAIVYVPIISVEAYKNARFWKDMNIVGKAINVEVNGLKYNVINTDSVEVVSNEDDNVNYPKLRMINIPETITINCSTYKVTKISSNAFTGCPNLQKVIIPTSVTNIEENAFGKCPKLKTVTLGECKIKIWQDRES